MMMMTTTTTTTITSRGACVVLAARQDDADIFVTDNLYSFRSIQAQLKALDTTLAAQQCEPSRNRESLGELLLSFFKHTHDILEYWAAGGEEVVCVYEVGRQAGKLG